MRGLALHRRGIAVGETAATAAGSLGYAVKLSNSTVKTLYAFCGGRANKREASSDGLETAARPGRRPGRCAMHSCTCTLDSVSQSRVHTM